MTEWNKNFGFPISMTLTQQESWFHPFSLILWHLRFLWLRRDILRLSQFLAIGFSPSELHVYNSAICKKGDRLFRRHFWSIFIVAAFPAYADSCIELVPHRNQLPMPGISWNWNWNPHAFLSQEFIVSQQNLHEVTPRPFLRTITWSTQDWSSIMKGRKWRLKLKRDWGQVGIWVSDSDTWKTG